MFGQLKSSYFDECDGVHNSKLWIVEIWRSNWGIYYSNPIPTMSSSVGHSISYETATHLCFWVPTSSGFHRPLWDSKRRGVSDSQSHSPCSGYRPACAHWCTPLGSAASAVSSVPVHRGFVTHAHARYLSKLSVLAIVHSRNIPST